MWWCVIWYKVPLFFQRIPCLPCRGGRSSFKMLVSFHQTIWHHNPQDSNLHDYHKNIKPLGKLDMRIITHERTTDTSCLTQQLCSRRSGKVECHIRWKWVHIWSTTAKCSWNPNSNILEPDHTQHNHPTAVLPPRNILLPHICHCAFIPARKN